jgi:uncharacterized membrane protein
MFAVAQALDVPQSLMAPVILLDPLIVYSWMGLLLALSGSQDRWAKATGVNPALQDALHAHVTNNAPAAVRPMTTGMFIVIVGAALSIGVAVMAFGVTVHGSMEPLREWLPATKVLTASTVGILLVTTLGIILSFTKVRNLEEFGASRYGYGLLFLMLPAFGAQADLRVLGSSLGYLLVALTMVACHAAMILLTMKLLRAPLFFGAVGSQSNLGGPASASLVAAAYNPALAPAGVLLGILGGVIGTYAGLATGMALRYLAG